MKKVLLSLLILVTVVTLSFAECCSCGNDSCSTGETCSTAECPQK
ncbi:hypothetical protein [Candidatus Ruminimicrobiellum ovillum]